MSVNNQKDFHIRYELDTGEIVEGAFTTKRLSIKDRSAIGMRKSQLSAGMYCVRDDDGKPTGQGLDEETDYLNAMIAHLEVALIRKPVWFDLNDVADVGLIQEVYGEVVDFESSFFRAKIQRENSRSGSVGKEDGSVERKEAVPANNPTPVVDQEVRASLDA